MAITKEIADRAQSLAKITGGKPEWYGTRKALTGAERTAGVVWDGAAGTYRAAAPGKLVKSECGSWGRTIHGTHRAGALTAAECWSLGLTPGPKND